MSRKLDPEIRERVQQRAKYLCDYCHANERWQFVEFTIDHIDPNEGNEFENLASPAFIATVENLTKLSPSIPQRKKLLSFSTRAVNGGTIILSGATTGILIQPKTSVGRATLDLLELNRPRILRIREADILAHRHPPVEDC